MIFYFLRVYDGIVDEGVNKTFINNSGVIETHFIGLQTKETLLAVRKEYEKLIAMLQSQQKKVCLLVDVDKVAKTDSGARATAVGILRDMPFSKVAVFGGDIIMRTVAKLIIAATERFVAIHYFSSREEAEKWLKE